MTAIPDVEAGVVSLVCDRCGEHTTAAVDSLRDLDVVWPALAAHGWAGSPFAAGSHQCATCRTRPGRQPSGADPAGWGERVSTDDARRERRQAPRPWWAEVARTPDAVVITPYGDITAEVAEKFRECLDLALAARQHLLVDMSRVNTLDPAGLAALVHAHCDAKRYGGAVCLVAPSRFVVTALHTMRVTTVFPTFDDGQEALAALASHGPPAADRSLPSGGSAPSSGEPVGAARGQLVTPVVRQVQHAGDQD